MRLRFWLSRVGAVSVELLAGLGVFFVGPLPGVHYPDPDLDPQDAWSPEFEHGPYGRRVRNQCPPSWHPERHCSAPPSRLERELWAALGIDVDARRR